jgi:KAP family P-loop domain
LSSAVDARWAGLSAPVKVAVRWAWSSARARSSREVDSVDLLIGILLADATGSPAKVLFDHFGIPAGEVLARADVTPPTAKSLLAATEPLTEMPLVATGVKQVFDFAESQAAVSQESVPVSLPGLFFAMLAHESPATRAINEALAGRGAAPATVARTLSGFLGGRQPLKEFLAERFPYRAPGVVLPDYLADHPDQPADLVGIGPEVDAFAHLIAAKRLVPPLAVGMFGDWGSGKSYFLRSLQRRINRISAARLPAFHQSIVQVEFNAWQYVGGDLWASLIEHLFRNLRMSGDDSDDLIAQRQQFWVQQVQAAGEAHQRAQEDRLELEQDQKTAADEVKSRKVELEKAAGALAAARQASPGKALKAAVKQAAKTAGFTELTDNAVQLGNELAQARNDLRSLLTPLRDKKYLAFVLIALVATPVIAYLTRRLDLSAVSTVAWLLGSAATYVAMAGNFIRRASKRIADAQAQLAEAEAKEHQRVEAEVQAAQQKLAGTQARLDTAVRRERELADRVDQVHREREAATPGRVLTDFITDRMGSEDYRRHLGVPALVRRDLERLSRLVKAQETTEPVPGQYAIDRIVLYIDDLDRCPTPVVIKVLEAVHLLLAFPLFVVVVAVDAQWLASSLRDHYRQLAGPDATPEDYLEKIFQVPFRIQPLDDQVRERMLRSLLAPSLAGAGELPRQAGGAEVTMPETDLDEFHEVLRSFTVTFGGAQALSETIDLTLTSRELQQAQDVAGLIGSTPRAVKRFANVYLLVKSIGAGRGLRLPNNGELVTLLALTLGLPRLADALFPALTAGADTLADALPTPSEKDRWYAQYRQFESWVQHRAGRDVKFGPELTGWLELIDRFRFPEGRSAGEPGRMDG